MATPVSRIGNLKSAWRVDRGTVNPGMEWSEALSAFLRSRKLGVYGAARAVTPRTIKEYAWDMKKFFDFMVAQGITHYNKLTERELHAYFAHLQSNGWSKATQRKYLISLKAFFRWVERDPDCEAAQMKSWANMLPRIPKEVRRDFVPSVEQMQAFLGGFDRDIVWGLRDYTVCALILETGARIGEICNLEEDDFKWDVSLVNLDGKTGKRLVPFDKERIERLVQNWLRVRERFANPKCKKVFITRFGGACASDTFRQSFADNLKAVKGLKESLGRNTISCHTLRHYFCTMYLVNGGSLHNLQRITGHKDINTLMIYVNLANQITSVREEAARVSPLKSLLEKKTAQGKTRQTVRL